MRNWTEKDYWEWHGVRSRGKRYFIWLFSVVSGILFPLGWRVMDVLFGLFRSRDYEMIKSSDLIIFPFVFSISVLLCMLVQKSRWEENEKLYQSFKSETKSK